VAGDPFDVEVPNKIAYFVRIKCSRETRKRTLDV
jgi:hypothetical protein